ncbi:hypothetical protein [Dactylosporangium sp. CS-033363]|uniref:hypothetical protein n=1 Tax=Dactylosporangium sp. CS-033363 TaxID=3239935 RepID=UPI003D8B6798
MSRKIRHTFVRPSWQCAGCGEAWPCADRRRRLLARYQGEALRLDLRTMLGTWMLRANRDLALPEEQAEARFIGWTYDDAAA